MITKLENAARRFFDWCLIHPPAESANIDSIRLFFSVSFLSLFGFLITSIFSWVSFSLGAESRGLFLAALSFMNIANYLLLRFSKNIWAAATIASILLLVIFFYLMFTGGLDLTGLYWCFALAPLYFFFVGHRWGLVITLMLAGFSYYALNTEDFVLMQAEYPEAVRERFSIIFAVVCFLLFIQELSRFRVDEHNKILTEKLELVARTDELSGLMNRRGAEEALYREFLRGKRSFRYASVVLLDIDHFKKINDQYGHAAGDSVIRLVANCLTQTVRDNDYVSRWGGEEFLIILTETNGRAVDLVSERIRKSVEEIQVNRGGNKFSVTISLGVANFTKGEGVKMVLKKADTALYQAKAEGRNRVVLANS